VFRPEARLATRRIALMAVLALAWTAPVAAQPRVDSLSLGPWLFRPSWYAFLQYDSNLLRTDESVFPAQSDSGREIGVEIDAALPFRNSVFELGYKAAKLNFRDTQFQRDYATEAKAALEFNFSTGDTLILRDVFIRDFVRIQDVIDDDTAVDAEEIFFGDPYDLNRADFVLTRSIPARQGYTVRVGRRDYNYKGDRDVGLYNYRGFDSTFEFSQPTYAGGFLVFHYNQRRFNHYRVRDPVGVPFRKEVSDTLQIGYSGNFGRGNPYFFRLGYERLLYEGQESSFRGLGGLYRSSFILGADDRLNVSVERQSLPSQQDTYYINNVVRLELDKKIMRTLKLRARTRAAFNNYGEPAFVSCGNERREDYVFGYELDFSWPVVRRTQIHLTGLHERRRSNCEGGNYRDNELRFGFRMGWF
jgi:hypothetical protein